MRHMNHDLRSLICWRQHWLALHLVGGRADCVSQDAVLLLQAGDLRVLVLQLLSCLLELCDRETSVSVGCQGGRRKTSSVFLGCCHFLNLSVRMWDWNWYTWVTKETHFYLHSLELLSLGLEAAQLLLQGCTLLPQHRLHPACLLLFNMKFLRQQHRTTLKHSDPALNFFLFFFKHHSLNKYTDVILYIL